MRTLIQIKFCELLSSCWFVIDFSEYKLKDHVDFWKEMLKDFNTYKKWFVITGITYGFRIPKKHPSMWPYGGDYRQRNFTSYEKNEIAQTIIKWLSKGVVYEVVNPAHVHLQPIYSIPKGSRAHPRGCRLIVHNSFPEGSSVNDLIPECFKKCELPTFQQVVEWMRELGDQGWLAIMDLESAWKQLRTHPEDIWMLGWYFEGRYFVDASASFGLAHIVRNFTIIDECIEFGFLNSIPKELVQKLQHRKFMAYIDDFAVGARSKMDCKILFEALQQLCEKLGLAFNKSKNQEPTQKPTYLGFQYDLQIQSIAIPERKILSFLKETEKIAKGARAITSDKLERLNGVVAHLSDAFWSGRHLIQSGYRLFYYPRKGSRKSRNRKIGHEYRADIRRIRDILKARLPVPLLQVSNRIGFSGMPMIVESDASGIGWGAVCGCRWIQGKWPEEMKKMNIEILESLAVLFAVNVWENHFKKAKFGVLLKIDNKPAMHSLRQGHSKNDTVRKVLKIIACQLSEMRVIWKTVYINTKKNVFADFLSRELDKDFVQFAKHKHKRSFRGDKDRFEGLNIDANLQISLPNLNWEKIVKLN